MGLKRGLKVRKIKETEQIVQSERTGNRYVLTPTKRRVKSGRGYDYVYGGDIIEP